MRKALPILISAAALLLSSCSIALPGFSVSVKFASAPDDTDGSGTVSDETISQAGSEDFVCSLSMTPEELPRFDGSTSTAPLAEALIGHILDLTPEEAAEKVQFNKTTTAYMNLLHGEADILIIGEANAEVMAEKEALGIEWEREPFATDAFVFVVNENNPVESITIDEARRIYTGEITNWKELGGDDVPIEAFQRNGSAGSQTLMEKWIMQGTPMAEAPAEYVVGTMGGLMEAVKSYDNSSAAIGYSVYYYAEEMRMAEGMKLLKLEGVEPNDQTIRSGEYPVVNPKYAVINAAEPEDSPARRIYDYLLSEEGQRLVALEGYVSVLDTGAERTAVTAGGRYYADYTDHLIPSDDYGTLIPFLGRRDMNRWPANHGCIYGLMTEDGRVVTDPVYCDCVSAGNYLILTLAEENENTEKRILLAASDGSWVTEPVYSAYEWHMGGKTALMDRDCNFVLVDENGEVFDTVTQAEHGLDSEGWKERLRGIDDGTFLWRDTYLNLNILPGGMSCRVFDLESRTIRNISLIGMEITDKREKAAIAAFDRLYSSAVEDGYEILIDQYNRKDYLLLKSVYTETTLYTDVYDRDRDFMFRTEATAWGTNRISLFNGIYGVITETEAKYYRYADGELIFSAYLALEPFEGDEE